MNARNSASDATPPRAVLVTGAARRIGAEIARALAGDGWRVYVHYNSSREEAEAVVADIAAAGGEAAAVRADLADAAAIRGLIEECAAGEVPLTALVNNASRFDFDKMDTLSPESFDAHHAINLRAPVLLSQEFARRLPDAEEGNIVNLLDNKVFAVNPDYFSYTVSKIALHGATRAMAMALAPDIRVNGIAPGITLVSGRQTPEQFARAHRNNPLGRGATPEDIVRALRFILATPAMTGETVVVDGGQILQRMPRDVAFLKDRAR